uniref:Methyl-CpG-binding domain protein 3-like 3 n=1 Tax=Moschus moschiferus TaxID=68415 RepID=A0A8C6CMZ2_MOSMO
MAGSCLIPHFIQILHLILFSKRLRRNMIPEELEKRRQELLVKAKQRRRDRCLLPLRLTSCISQKPVTRITSHPGNVVRRRLCEEILEKPQQVFAFQRLQGLQAYSPEGEPFRTMDSANVSGMIVQGGAGESLGRVGAWSQHTSTEPILAQSSDGAELNPRLGLFLPQALCRRRVKDADIRRQSRKVKRAREKLTMALRADRLAREAEPGIDLLSPELAGGF